MQTFTLKQNQPQKPVSSGLARSNIVRPAPEHCDHPILHLQRTIGNQAVQRVLQTNAEDLKAGLTGTAAPRLGHDFSRIPIHSPVAGAIQTKLAISKPGDVYEQEADRVAEQVMHMPEPQLQRACACGRECPQCQAEQVMSMTPLLTPNVQRQTRERAAAQPNLLEIPIGDDQVTPARALEATVQAKLTMNDQAESINLIQRQPKSPDDQGDCSGWERDCESFCNTAAKQYWVDVDGVQPPAVKDIDCKKSPGNAMCIVTFKGELTVSVAKTSPGKTLEIWRIRGSGKPNWFYEILHANMNITVLLNLLY